jgi:SpoVK/Ycf46/Vps4 family AAA+-type ATPase
LLFVATSNFPQAVDNAFMSRCDLIMEVPLPGRDACRQILEDCLLGLAETFEGVRGVLDSPEFESCANECEGLDGRTIRKVVANALATNPQVAIDPNKLTVDELAEAIQNARSRKAIHK